MNECPRKRVSGSHTDHDRDSWANMVKPSYNNEVSSEFNYITGELKSINYKTQTSTVLKTRSSESNGKQQMDPTTTVPHTCQTVNDSVTEFDNTQETANVEMLEKDTNVAPQVTHNVTPKETKWNDLINTETDAEHDQEQHGKRDKSRLIK